MSYVRLALEILGGGVLVLIGLSIAAGIALAIEHGACRPKWTPDSYRADKPERRA